MRMRRLGDVCEKIGSGFTPHGGSSVYQSSGIPLIRSQNVHNEGFSSSGLAYLNEEQAAALDIVSVRQDDVLLNITGDSVARVCQVPEHFIPARVNQHVAIIRPNKAILNPRYLLYFLLSPQMQQYMLSLASEGGTRKALTKAMIEDFQIPTPPQDEQTFIVEMLGCLDNKIELNHQMNKTLEEIVQELFKHWFVDFEFPNEQGEPYKPSGGKMDSPELGEVPYGWNVAGVDCIADYVNGKAFTAQATKRGRAIIKIAELKSGVKATTKRYDGQADPSNIAYFDDILFSWSASLDLFRWWGEESAINQHIFKVIPRDYFTKPFVYYTLKSVMPHFQAIASTKVTTMGHIKRDHLGDEKVVIPPKEIIQKFEETAGPFYHKIALNSQENGILSSLRDTVLPELLSGKIKATSTQIKQSEAAPMPQTSVLEQKTLPAWYDMSEYDARKKSC